MRRITIALFCLMLLTAACKGKARVTLPSGSPSATAVSPTPTIPSTGGTASPSATIEPGGYGWNANASDYRSLKGQRLEYGCPPGGTLGGVYGTGTYTDDSSVCSAAVHAGKTTQANGGQVVIEIKPGEKAYQASEANGVTSAEFGAYDGSYVVVSSNTFRGTTEAQTGGYGWAKNATELRGLNGQRFVFNCPPGGAPGSLYGTRTYTDDSSVCTAAVHDGRITIAKGGRVIIEAKAGEASYKGTAANGLTSAEYGQWHGSFSFVAT
jgi:hypothetical protein